ncbi:histone demethylase [Aureococcus anophagefferens]|nr:histone demethylase [Aureococcus anophagefferens]
MVDLPEPPSAGNNEPPSAGNNATPPRKPEAAIGEADARRPREALEIRALSAGLTALVMALALDLELHGRARSLEEVRLEEAAMALATAWAGVLTVVAGYYAHPGWRALQPFEGGGGFVTVQALGWMLYACSLFAIVVMAANAPAAPRGAAFAVGGVVLCGAGDALARAGLADRPSPLAAALLAALEASAPSLIASGAGCLGIGALVTHGVHGPLAVGGYRPWMPFDGGSRFVLLQALAWTLCGVVSDVLLAVGPGAAGRADKPASRARAPPPRASPERLAALLFLACSVVGFALGIYAPRYAGEKAPAYVMATFLAHGAAPLAHVGGARARRGYGVFMVGVGGPKFVITQACGWMLYSVSVLATIVVLCLNDAAPRPLMVALAPLAVISSGIIVASVPLFEAQETAFPEATGGDAADVERCRRSWGVSCDAAKLFADDGAGGAPARAAAARAACEELWRLRQAAASAPARALTRPSRLSARTRRVAWAWTSTRARSRRTTTTIRTRVIYVRRRPRARRRPRGGGGGARAAEFLGVLAAPLASALGVVPPRTRRGRFVALRLVALAAWSFAVLASLAALLRYSLGRGRGAISREFFGDASGSPSPHALLGLGGVGLQGLALLLSEASAAAARAAADGARALGWKFACFLHDRGAPVLRCGICGDVDDAQGPNEFVLAPCARAALTAPRDRRCLEGAGLPAVVGAAGAAGRDVGACARCGRGLAPGLRHPAGPRELGAAPLRDRHRAASGPLPPRTFFCFAVATRLERARRAASP